MLPPLQGHTLKVNSVAFSPDGSKIIPGSFDRTIRGWDASRGIELLRPAKKGDDTLAVSMSTPDCRIVSLHDGWFVNSITGSCLCRLPVHLSFRDWRIKKSYRVGWTMDSRNS